MLKKLMISGIALAASVTFAAASFAADVYRTIDIENFDHPNITYHPQAIYINTGDTLHLAIRNPREEYTRIFMPAISLDQEIPKDNIATLDICFSNPTDDVMWFQISSVGGEKIPGYVVVKDFKVPNANVVSKTVDTSALAPIINYSTAFNFPEKPEPKYRPQPAGAAAPVRGYW